MKLSIYTAVKDGLYYDFHVVQMLKHHLPLADEIVVNEGYSTDGTYEAICDLDPKIKIDRNTWDRTDPKTWRQKFITRARSLATGDWCIMLDADEFIPEWEFDRLRTFLASTESLVIPVGFVHFYANYRVIHAHGTKVGWPDVGMRIHRNVDRFEVWGDASNVRLAGARGMQPEYASERFTCHHFGAVRDPARLRHKWRIQKMRNQDNKWSKMPAVAFDLKPHEWKDPDFLPDLAIYEGPHMQTVLDDPAEFTRDEMAIYHLLRDQQSQETA